MLCSQCGRRKKTEEEKGVRRVNRGGEGGRGSGFKQEGEGKRRSRGKKDIDDNDGGGDGRQTTARAPRAST